MRSSRELDRLITSNFRHDIINPLQVLKFSYMEESSVLSFEEVDEDRFEEFLGVLDAAVERLKFSEDLSFADQEIEWLADYEGEFSGLVGEKVDNVANLSEDVVPYVENQGNNREDSLDLEDLLEPIEKEGEVDYNGLSSQRIYGDKGLCLVANTIALNFREHTGDEANLYAEIRDMDEHYKIGIWDDGPGIEDYEGDEIFEKGNGDNSGNGLYFARQITDMFDGELERSRENEEREGGFGLEWYLRPAQYSTSESE